MTGHFFQEMDKEEFQGAVADDEGTGRPVRGLAPAQEIVFQFLFCNLQSIFVDVFRNLTSGSGLRFLSRITFSCELQSIDRFVAPGGLKCMGHDISPFLWLWQTLRRDSPSGRLPTPFDLMQAHLSGFHQVASCI